MAFLGKQYRAEDLPEQQEYAALPAGEYQVRIEKSELKQTKARNGEMIALQMKVLGPTHAGRVLFDYIIIGHQNPTAEEIGLARFGTLVRAVGFPVEDSDQLINKEVNVKISIEKGDERNPDDKNKVQKYMAFSAPGGLPPHMQQQPAQQQQPPQQPPAQYSQQPPAQYNQQPPQNMAPPAQNTAPAQQQPPAQYDYPEANQAQSNQAGMNPPPWRR